ncbi:MAG: hypothetical protein GKR89_27400 [Candidatus Latescibacteria bacterium]|nr:hypothetical protein [Candidatus Latescibacterota bacterium]
MQPTFKQLTQFFIDVGADQVSHTNKTYLAHAIGVYRDLKAWGCTEELARVGLFHSIYGTEIFQGFTLPVERRGEIRELIGERAEFLAYVNCAMDRASFDAQVLETEAPYTITDRLTGGPIAMNQENFDDLVRIHLCDWLEQVARWGQWDYRRETFENMAQRLGGVALDSFNQIFAQAPPTAV